jgi:hypothetical protein
MHPIQVRFPFEWSITHVDSSVIIGASLSNLKLRFQLKEHGVV